MARGGGVAGQILAGETHEIPRARGGEVVERVALDAGVDEQVEQRQEGQPQPRQISQPAPHGLPAARRGDHGVRRQEHDQGDDVRVGGGCRGEYVEHRPERPRVPEGSLQERERERGEEHHEAVGARLLRVPDRKRIDRQESRAEQARAFREQLPARPPGGGHGGHAGDDGRRAHELRGIAQAHERPQHELVQRSVGLEPEQPDHVRERPLGQRYASTPRPTRCPGGRAPAAAGARASAVSPASGATSRRPPPARDPSPRAARPAPPSPCIASKWRRPASCRRSCARRARRGSPRSPSSRT